MSISPATWMTPRAANTVNIRRIKRERTRGSWYEFVYILAACWPDGTIRLFGEVPEGLKGQSYTEYEHFPYEAFWQFVDPETTLVFMDNGVVEPADYDRAADEYERTGKWQNTMLNVRAGDVWGERLIDVPKRIVPEMAARFEERLRQTDRGRRTLDFYGSNSRLVVV